MRRDREPCHSGGEQHGTAYDLGVFGWLCAGCWISVCRILNRDLGATAARNLCAAYQPTAPCGTMTGAI